jgi:hypothetical protein
MPSMSTSRPWHIRRSRLKRGTAASPPSERGAGTLLRPEKRNPRDHPVTIVAVQCAAPLLPSKKTLQNYDMNLANTGNRKKRKGDHQTGSLTGSQTGSRRKASQRNRKRGVYYLGCFTDSHKSYVIIRTSI